MTLRASTWKARLSSLRPGVVLAIAVVSVVGVAGILRWDRSLILVGFVAGAAVISINVVLVVTWHWHRRNTQLDAIYSGPEDSIRLRRRGHSTTSKRR